MAADIATRIIYHGQTAVHTITTYGIPHSIPPHLRRSTKQATASLRILDIS